MDVEKHPAMRSSSQLVGRPEVNQPSPVLVTTLFLKLGFLRRIGWAFKLNAVAVGVG